MLVTETCRMGRAAVKWWSLVRLLGKGTYEEEDGVDCGEVGEIGGVASEEIVQRLDSE